MNVSCFGRKQLEQITLLYRINQDANTNKSLDSDCVPTTVGGRTRVSLWKFFPCYSMKLVRAVCLVLLLHQPPVKRSSGLLNS